VSKYFVAHQLKISSSTKKLAVYIYTQEDLGGQAGIPSNT